MGACLAGRAFKAQATWPEAFSIPHSKARKGGSGMGMGRPLVSEWKHPLEGVATWGGEGGTTEKEAERLEGWA